jgi:hypothetical protein
MSFNNSPLLAMAPLASPNNGLHRHQSGQGSSSSSSQQDSNTSAVVNKFHQIPFQATPVQHGPTPLSFGFGFGSSSICSPSSTSMNQSGTTSQWGQSPSHMSPSIHHSPSSRALNTAPGKRSETKRRRDSEDDDSDDDMEGGREKSASPMSYNRVFASKQALPKRMRAGIGAVGMTDLNDSRPSSSVKPSMAASDQSASGSTYAVDKMDLGRILGKCAIVALVISDICS